MKKSYIINFSFVLVFILLSFALENCCSIVVPPVVLTGAKTATEKQIVGSEKRIEKNAWLIASAKTSKAQMETKWAELSKEEKQQKKQIQFKLFRALRTIEFFRNQLKKYRRNYILGENINGELVELAPLVEAKLIPKDKFEMIYTPEIKAKYNKPKEKKKIQDLIKRINSARKDLLENMVSALNKNLSDEQKKQEKALIQKRIKYDIIRELEPGNWYEKVSGGWVQKKGSN